MSFRYVRTCARCASLVCIYEIVKKVFYFYIGYLPKNIVSKLATPGCLMYSNELILTRVKFTCDDAADEQVDAEFKYLKLNAYAFEGSIR